jgi:hypothetical protein
LLKVAVALVALAMDTTLGLAQAELMLAMAAVMAAQAENLALLILQTFSPAGVGAQVAMLATVALVQILQAHTQAVMLVAEEVVVEPLLDMALAVDLLAAV